MEGSPDIKPREANLKEQWKGKNDRTTVNSIQFSFDSPERERKFIEDQFPSEEERAKYAWYRSEWYRRAKEFDPGPAPLAVCCELVSSCQLGCTMCYTITEDFQGSVVGAQRIMPWSTAKAVIDEAAEMGVPSILFSWRGESSVYRSKDEDGNTITFPDVLKYARQKGILEITCLTNGQLIDEARAREIVDAEPSWLSFSIDGLKKAYNKIRTPPNKKNTDYDAFEEVSKSIRRIIRIRDEEGKTRPQIRTNTIYPAIAEDPQAYKDYMTNLGVGWVTVNELLDFRDEVLPPERVNMDWACQYPFQRLTVSANGTVLPCTGAWSEDDGLILGRYEGSRKKRVKNAKGEFETIDTPETTLRAAWKSEKIEYIRKLHKENRRVEIDPGCRNCSHGAKKNGVDWLPGDWDINQQDWV